MTCLLFLEQHFSTLCSRRPSPPIPAVTSPVGPRHHLPYHNFFQISLCTFATGALPIHHPRELAPVRAPSECEAQLRRGRSSAASHLASTAEGVCIAERASSAAVHLESSAAGHLSSAAAVSSSTASSSSTVSPVWIFPDEEASRLGRRAPGRCCSFTPWPVRSRRG